MASHCTKNQATTQIELKILKLHVSSFQMTVYSSEDTRSTAFKRLSYMIRTIKNGLQVEMGSNIFCHTGGR